MKKIAILAIPFMLAMCSKSGAEPAPAPGPDPNTGTTTTTVAGDPEINVMTFNIRYENTGDGENIWANRRDRVANCIKFYDVDILGTQEVLHSQLVDLKNRLPEYEVLGVGREDGKEKGEYSALWYKKDRFNPYRTGYFWLSATPDQVSKGWDGACERIATWAVFRDNVNKKDVFVLNTHLDHVGVQARAEGVKLLNEKIKELSNGMPVIVTGDFNATPESDVIANLKNGGLRDSREVSPLVYGPNWSWHDWQGYNYAYRGILDYVFTKNGLNVKRYGILAETQDGKYLSDHCPVLVTVTF